MKITVKRTTLEKSLSNASEMKKTYGQLAKRISQRMDTILAADNLEVLISLRALECHPLKGDRIGEWSISISGNWRLVFDITEDPLPLTKDNTIDAKRVTQIRLLEVVDYH